MTWNILNTLLSGSHVVKGCRVAPQSQRVSRRGGQCGSINETDDIEQKATIALRL
jgi:hypothetical protein